VKGELHPWNLQLWQQLELARRAAPPSLLLAGPRGVGKAAFALHLAQASLCQRPAEDGQPCGSCQSCRLFLGDNHPDFRLVQDAGPKEDSTEEEGARPRTGAPARWIRVDQIRELGDLLALRPHLSRRRVVLVEPADRLHPSASNALLKTLEEPPADTHFILVTAFAARLPATVVSRCVRMTFALPARAVALSWLKGQGGEQAELALAQAGSAPLLAHTLDTAEYWSKRERVIGQILLRPNFDPVAASERITGEELVFLVGTLQRWCHDLLLALAIRTVRYNPDRAQILHELAARSSPQRIVGLLRDLQSVARFLEHPLNPRLVAERCLIGYKRAVA
jgi:DNA polymerase-3 subunit delta'